MDAAVRVFLAELARWSHERSDVLVALLVGSYARGTARPDSDIDLVIVTDRPAVLLGDDAWLTAFGTVLRIEDEDWGTVQSRRVFFSSGLEVEFGITTREWIRTDPLDNGTRRIVNDGVRIVSDPHGMAAELVRASLTDSL